MSFRVSDATAVRAAGSFPADEPESKKILVEPACGAGLALEAFLQQNGFAMQHAVPEHEVHKADREVALEACV